METNNKSFNLTILNSERLIYEGRVLSLIAPAESGYLGVLSGHAPLIAIIKKGRVIIKKYSLETQIIDCEDKGFLEVLNNNVTLLLQTSIGPLKTAD